MGFDSLLDMLNKRRQELFKRHQQIDPAVQKQERSYDDAPQKQRISPFIHARRSECEMQIFVMKTVLPVLEKENPAFHFIENEIKYSNDVDTPCNIIHGLPSTKKYDYSFISQIVFPLDMANEDGPEKLIAAFHELGHLSKTSCCVFNNKLYIKTGIHVFEIEHQQTAENQFIPVTKQEIGRGLNEGIQQQEALYNTSIALTNEIGHVDDHGPYRPLVNLYAYTSWAAKSEKFLQKLDRMPISQCLGLYLQLFEEHPKNEFAFRFKNYLKAFDSIHDRAVELNGKGKFNSKTFELQDNEKQAFKYWEQFCNENPIRKADKFFSKMDGIERDWSVLEKMQHKYEIAQKFAQMNQQGFQIPKELE